MSDETVAVFFPVCDRHDQRDDCLQRQVGAAGVDGQRRHVQWIRFTPPQDNSETRFLFLSCFFSKTEG